MIRILGATYLYLVLVNTSYTIVAVVALVASWVGIIPLRALELAGQANYEEL